MSELASCVYLVEIYSDELHSAGSINEPAVRNFSCQHETCILERRSSYSGNAIYTSLHALPDECPRQHLCGKNAKRLNLKYSAKIHREVKVERDYLYYS